MLDVLQSAYSDTPKYLWATAGGNVLLHVGRLGKLGKLPQVRRLSSPAGRLCNRIWGGWRPGLCVVCKSVKLAWAEHTFCKLVASGVFQTAAAR